MPDNVTHLQIKKFAAEILQPETMEKIIEAVRAVLGGEDVPMSIVGAAMQSAAGYNYAIETGKKEPSEMFILSSIAGLHLGASLAPCQCSKCSKARAKAQAGADDVLRKAAGK